MGFLKKLAKLPIKVGRKTTKKARKVGKKVRKKAVSTARKHVKKGVRIHKKTSPIRATKKAKKKRKVFASRQPIALDEDRPNKFLDMPASSMHTDDTKNFDKKVKSASSRKDNIRNTIVTAMCKTCEYEFEISEKMAFNDPDLGLVFICDECMRK